MSKRTYYLVIYEAGKPKWDINAKKSIITPEVATKILADNGRPTIKRKEDGLSYKVIEKRVFEYSESGKETVLMIILDCEKIS
ncbi:MAG TPA: hypothetical protein VK622_09730 [Puia sp.]|nr:hypothetical protein [Puia sp.]